MTDMVHNINVKVYITDSSKLQDKGLFQQLYDNANEYRREKIDKTEKRYHRR